jgi:type IV secretion system protein VirB10
LIGVQSVYEVKAGGFIPVALITAINSDLPGEVIAQVRENVYDTVSGEHLLIPQGTRVLGKYQSLISNGQNRALIVWTRLVMPNGNGIVLDGMPGTDQSGAAGAEDEVDYHLDKLAAAATLSTAIAYGGNLAREGGRDRDDLDVVGETIAQQSSKIGGRLIDRQLDVQPTIRIRQGYSMNVMVNKDMVLEPYREN